MLEPEAIVALLQAAWQPKILQGHTVLVTAGPTFEAIDPVRGITNSSSGKMGYAVARAAQEAGAQVTLVSGPVALETPAGVERVNVRTAQQMFDSVKSRVKGSDIFISVAAVADWKVKNSFSKKIKKINGSAPQLQFEENPDILAWVAAQKNAPFCVGFAAESEKVEANAKAKRLKKGVPLIAANLAQQALGADDNAITLFDARGRHSLGSGPKLEQARKLLAHVAGMLQKAKR